MSNYKIDPKSVDSRSYSKPIVLRGGVDQESSKFSAAPGTLYDCLNYVAGPNGYERLMGLRMYDGTFDRPVRNYVTLNCDDTNATFTGTAFTLGGSMSWGDSGEYTATVIFWDRAGSGSHDTYLYFIDVQGRLPQNGDVVYDDETGAYLTFTGAIAPVQLIDPASSIEDNISVGQYLNDGEVIELGLTQSTDVITNTPHNTYHGVIPGTGSVTGGWQHSDEVYAVRDGYAVKFYNGGIFDYAPITAGQVIQVPYETGNYEYARIYRVFKTGDYWETGNASGYLLVGPSDFIGQETTDLRNLDNIELAAYIKDTSGNNIAQATVPDVPGSIGGLVWKATVQGWEFVNTGWTLEFDTGTNAPNVPDAPLFQEDLISAARTTGSVFASNGLSRGSLTSWVLPGNIVSDNAVYTATASLATGDRTDILVALFSSTLVPITECKINGIKVTIEAYTSGAGGLPYDHIVQLGFQGDFGHTEISENRATRTPLTGAPAVYTYGGEDDLWGLDEITAEQINDGDFEVNFQYYNPDVLGGALAVDYVKIEVFYTPTKEYVYFYDGAADVAEGYVTAYQQLSGEFSIDTAAGNMTIDFSPINNEEINVQNIITGTQIRTGATGTGVLIGYVTRVPKYNLLPSWNEMVAAGSMYQTTSANFYENDESLSVYGATGASKAFMYSNNGFAFIQTPLASVVDIPRHVAFHDNRLALGFQPGFVALSAVGVPNDFTGVTGADPSLWGIGDRITGLLSLTSNVLIVLSESSIRSLEGSGADTGTMKVISPSSGAKEYTAVVMGGQIVFTDNRGVTTLEATDKYGDFSLGRLTDKIQTWIQNRVQNTPISSVLDNGPVCAIALRNRNQYRLFFRDGYGLVLYFNTEGFVEPTFFNYSLHGYTEDAPEIPEDISFVPTWVDSSVLSSGRERVVLGATYGIPFIVDGSDASYAPGSANLQFFPSWIILNPISLGTSETLGKTVYVALQGRHQGYIPLYWWADDNYVFHKIGDPELSAATGDLLDGTVLSYTSFITRPYLPTLTDGITIKVGTNFRYSYLGNNAYGWDRAAPHVLQSIIVRSSATASNRTRASKEY